MVAKVNLSAGMMPTLIQQLGLIDRGRGWDPVLDDGVELAVILPWDPDSRYSWRDLMRIPLEDRPPPMYMTRRSAGAGGAGTDTKIQLRNPSTSGVIVQLRSVYCWTPTAGGPHIINVNRDTAALGAPTAASGARVASPPGTFQPQSKALTDTDSAAGSLGTDAGIFGLAAQNTPIFIPQAAGIILNQGRTVRLNPATQNIDLFSVWEWDEYIIAD